MLNALRLGAGCVVFVLFAACAGEAPSQGGSPPGEGITAVTASPSSPAEPSVASNPAPGGIGTLLEAERLTSLRGLVEIHPYVLVGRVEEGADVFYYPEGDRCGIPLTAFPVAVERVIAAPQVDLPPAIPVVLNTGPERCAVVDGGGEKPLEPGQRYLFFLYEHAWETRRGYNGYGFARFEITPDGKITPTGGERDFPGVAAVSGVTPEEVRAAMSAPDPKAALAALARVTVDEAAAKIQAAVAEAPLPTRTPPPAP